MTEKPDAKNWMRGFFWLPKALEELKDLAQIICWSIFFKELLTETMSSVDLNHQSDHKQKKKWYLAWNFPFVDLFTFVTGRKSRVIAVKKVRENAMVIFWR